MRQKLLISAFDGWSEKNQGKPEDIADWSEGDQVAWEELELLRSLVGTSN